MKEKKNYILEAENGKYNLKGNDVQLVLEQIRKYTKYSIEWICILMVAVILQIYFVFREPVLEYKIANLVLITLGLIAGFKAISKIIKIQRTVK